MAALWGGARPAGARGTRRRGRGEGSGPELPLPPCAPPQCFSLEEDEPGLHLASLQAGTILEAEEILGTMQSYLDSSMISVIEDFSSLNESKACLDVPNELSLLTAITEILDSTDDETLSPFDTTMDSELLALPRERESSSFQKFLSLSRPSPEHSVPALDDPWGPSCTATARKAETGSVDLPCDRPLSCLEDPATPKKPPSRAHRAERPLARPPQRSDGEEEEAASPGQPGRVAAAGHLAQSVVGFCAAAVSQEDGAELEAGWPEDSDVPCIIHTGGVSLSELVRSMHPYCLPTLTVCLDPACEPVAQDFLTGPLMLEIVPGEGEGLEIPVVLQQLGPGAQLSAEEEGASGCLAGKGASGLEPLPTEGVVPEGWLGTPAQGHEAEGPGSAPQEEPPRPPRARERDPGAQDEARQGDHRPESSSRRSTEAPAGGKRQGTEKGRGRERARKSRKKRREGSQKGQAEPDGNAVVHRLRSASSVQPPTPQRCPTWTAHPSVQVSTFLEKQLEQAKKEGQMELRSSRAPRARGRPRAAAPGGSLQRKSHPEVQKEPKPDPQPAVEAAESPGPPEPAVPSSEEQPADVGPGPAEQGEGAAGCGEGSWPVPTQGSTSPEAAPPPGCGVPGAEGEDVERAGAWPIKEAKPKALSLREYRLRMLRRQPGGADRKDAERPAASKWPSVPEPPTELAEIPCLLAPVRPSQPAQPVETPSSPKPSSPPATPPPASKAPAGAPQTVPAPMPPGLQLPFLPPAMGAAPAGIPPPSASPYSLYPPVPSWPCLAPPPAGYPGLPPPPGAVPGGSPNAFHVVPGLPPPALAWPSPSLPPSSFGPGVPCAPMGWALGLQPSYWPGVPLPPPAPPVVYGEAGAALQSPGVQPFLASPLPEGAGAHRPEALVRRAACAHSLALAAPALSCQEPSASTARPTRPLATAAGQATAAAKHRDPAQPPQRRAQPSARAAAGRASDPRRQSQPVEESLVGQPPITAATTQPVGEPVSTAAPQPVGETPAPLTREPPALWPVGEPAAQPTGEPPVPQTVGEPTAPMGESHALWPTGEPSIATTWPIREPPDTCPTAEAAAPAKVPEPSLLQGAQPDPKGAAPQEPRLPGPTPALGKAAPLRARAENQPAKLAPARPWRHQPLVSPAQPAGSQDIVQAFISEIGIEASDLSSLLEQFEKSEAKKEELRVRRPGDRPAAGNAGSEGHQDKTPLDSLHAPELANVAGEALGPDPSATPPHQLWKPLAAVSLLAKPRSPGAAPREGSQRSAKFMEAKPLPQSKPRGKGPSPSHVGSGDHDYCARGTAQPEEAARLPGAPAPTELGSRWNVKHHQDITIKPLSSLPTRTLGRPGLSPLPAPAPGSSEQLDHRTSARSRAAAVRSSPPTSVLLSPDASPCRDEEPRTRDLPPKHSAAKRSLRCYRRRGASPSPRASRAHASRSFSSTSNGTSTSSSSSSSSSRSRSRSLSPPPKRWRRYRARRSRSAHSSRSSCGSCGRSRRSSSSSSSYSSRSSSSSRSRSRSPSPPRPRTRRRRYDYCDPPDHCQRQKVLHKERAIEERRVVFVGKIPSRMTRAELRHRFAIFGDIEECTLHFRAEGDNYGFVTYRYAQEAFAAIESGHKLRRPDEQPFDLCFGGRRQFCRRNYADLDSNREDFDPAPVKSKFDSLDFDTLLKQAQRSLRR